MGCFKKIILLMVMLFLISPVSAQEKRYENIIYQGKIVSTFDTETIHYEKDPYRDELLIDVWIKTIPDQYSGSYSLSHYYFRQQKREFMLIRQLEYNGDNQIIGDYSITYDPNLWSTIIPETVSDQWYITTLKYAKENIKNRKEMRKSNENHSYDKFNAWLYDVGNMFGGN